MFKVDCKLVEIKDRGIYVCKCPILNSIHGSSTKIFSNSVNVFIQTFFYKKVSKNNVDTVIDYLKNVCAVFSLREFEYYRLELSGCTLTFNLNVDFYDEKLKDSFTLLWDDLVKNLKDNYSILEYKLINA